MQDYVLTCGGGRKGVVATAVARRATMSKGFRFSISRLFAVRRRARIGSVAAEAEALVRDFGAAAYSEARKREQEASSDAIAEDWRRVALAVARKLGSQVGPDASDPQPARIHGPGAPPPRQRRPRSKSREQDEPKGVLPGRPQLFRIQFVGASSDHRTSILKEVEIQVLDVSSAIVEAANLQWPPATIALRILDGEGREVFERHRADRR